MTMELPSSLDIIGWASLQEQDTFFPNTQEEIIYLAQLWLVLNYWLIGLP